MKVTELFVLVISIVMIFISCGKDSDSSDTATASATYAKCVVQPSGYDFCHYFSGWSTDGLASAKTDCESASGLGGTGTWTESTTAATAACSTTNKLGECTWASGSNSIVTNYVTSSSVADATAGSTACTDTWTGTWEAKTTLRLNFLEVF